MSLQKYQRSTQQILSHSLRKNMEFRQNQSQHSARTNKIVAPEGMKQIGSATTAERGQHIAMLVAVNAVGNSLPPTLIFPVFSLRKRCCLVGLLGVLELLIHLNGRQKKLFLIYLDHFLVSTKCSKEDSVLLIVENRETHLSIEALEKALAASS